MDLAGLVHANAIYGALLVMVISILTISAASYYIIIAVLCVMQFISDSWFGFRHSRKNKTALIY